MALFENTREDLVEFFVFPTLDKEDEENLLQNLFNSIQTVSAKYVENYMWHLDEFKLTVRSSKFHVPGQEDDLPPHLYGVLHYGENIEDEWFLVFILLQITKEIPEVCIRVVDADGEFLLIEAANYLPNWAKPETCEKRVYIYQGRVHLVKPDKDEVDTNVTDAVKRVINKPEQTKASDDIQNSILQRIKCFPDSIPNTLHRTVAFVPVGVAAILKSHPNLIAPAVRAFCNRDTIDMKACRAMKFFPPENRVYCNVVMTKFLYAMLLHSKYVPDRRTGWSLPAANSSEYKRHILGVKIACGFEILASQAKQDSDLSSDRGWHLYLESLKTKGYFKDLLENSQEHNILLRQAEQYYRSFKELIPDTSKIGVKVLDLVRNSNYNVEELREQQNSLSEDSDSWLNIGPEELDNMLEKQYGHKNMYTSNGNNNADSFSTKVNSFLNHISEIEGAEFPNESEKSNNSPVPPPRGIKTKGKNKVSFAGDETKENASAAKVNFDPNFFSCALQNMLDLVIPDDNWDLESDSDMSAYGEEEEGTEECKKISSKIKEYMDIMDKELAQTTIGQSFTKKEKDNFDNVEDFTPVDIDMNALKNILESYQTQMGEAGPASNMLGPMGMNLDRIMNERKQNGDSSD